MRHFSIIFATVFLQALTSADQSCAVNPKQLKCRRGKPVGGNSGQSKSSGITQWVMQATPAIEDEIQKVTSSPKSHGITQWVGFFTPAVEYNYNDDHEDDNEYNEYDDYNDYYEYDDDDNNKYADYNKYDDDYSDNYYHTSKSPHLPRRLHALGTSHRMHRRMWRMWNLENPKNLCPRMCLHWPLRTRGKLQLFPVLVPAPVVLRTKKKDLFPGQKPAILQLLTSLVEPVPVH
ncbi:unnamed protein product, partial [Mesorhabditis spiculigera]